jgi:serine protease Do
VNSTAFPRGIGALGRCKIIAAVVFSPAMPVFSKFARLLPLVGAGLLGVSVSAPAEMAVAPPLTLPALVEVQKTVQDHLGRVRQSLVVLRHGDGTASGVIVSPDGLILTAAHVTMKPGARVTVVMPDGTLQKATALGLDDKTDAGLAQLDRRGKKRAWPFVEVERDVGKVDVGSWCFALGHPGGWDKERGLVLRVGRVLKQKANSLETDCVLMGGDSGGPLFDLKGKLIGIHSQILSERNQNVHVSMAPFLRSWDRMKGSQVIQTWATGSGGYLGVAVMQAASDPTAVEVEEVIPGSPAERAGLKTADRLLEVNRESLIDDSHFAAIVRQRAPGDVVTLKIRRGEVDRVLEVKLGQKPVEEEPEPTASTPTPRNTPASKP